MILWTYFAIVMMVQIIFFFPGNIESNSGYFENRILVRWGGGGGEGGGDAYGVSQTT